MDETTLGAWMATGLTLFIFSFLYQDNPLFKLAEHLYVGVSVGYTIVKTCDSVVVSLIYRPIVEQGEIALLIPVAIGFLMLTRYVPKAAWMSRYAFAFIVGLGSGLAIPRTISSFILKQVEDTVRPLLSMAGGDGLTFSMNLLSPASNLNSIIILIGVSSVLFYDPVDRVVATVHPDYSFEKTVFDAWRQATWDANDTVLIADPRADTDVGDYFRRLYGADPGAYTSWHQRRIGGTLGSTPEERTATPQRSSRSGGTPRTTASARATSSAARSAR